MREWILACVGMCLAWAAMAQCDGIRYRYRMFDQVEVTQGVFYGANTGSSGSNVELDMDIYRPAGDEELNRPVVILAHGGFFLAGSNDGVDVVPLCEDLARMGYVAASISYRLGIDNVFDLETSLQEAVLAGCTMRKLPCVFSVALMQKRAILGASTHRESCWAGRLQVHSLRCMRRTSTTCQKCPTSLTSRSKAWAEASKGTAGILVMALTCFRSSTFRARLAMQIGSRQATCPC